MLVLTLITAGQRFLKVWRQASAPLPIAARKRGAGSRRLTSRRTARTTVRRADQRGRLRRPR
jgi:hypothetical protein